MVGRPDGRDPVTWDHGGACCPSHMGPKYPDGVFDFKALVTGGYRFVDKTMLIADLCGSVNQMFIFTRPRRFGKSINLSMLDYFFNIRYRGGKDIFEGLKISECHGFDGHRNAYPVIRMNFGKLRGDSVDSFRESLEELLSKTANSFRYLLEHAESDDVNADRLLRTLRKESNIYELRGFLPSLCELLYDHHGKDPIILVDEYDHCIQGIPSVPKSDEILSEMGDFLQESFKFNDHIQFGVVTGIMPLSKTSMLSSFNNAKVCSILDSRGDEFFGFTESEVMELLESTGNPSEKMGEIKEWYDGYHFGDIDVYNPYSVIMYLENGCRPEAYWNNMTGGSLSEKLVSNMSPESLSLLKGLYERDGSTFESIVDTRVVYADAIAPPVRPSTAISYLAMAGYLKAVRTGEQSDGRPVCSISMVNKEVRSAFRDLVDRAVRTERIVREAIGSIYAHDAEGLSSDIESLLSGIEMDRNWILDDDPSLRHNRYRDLIMAYLVTPQRIAMEELPKGYGRTDIFFPASCDEPPIIIEVKTTTDPGKDLEVLAGEALRQIERMRYADEPGSEDAVCLGIGIRMRTVGIRFL